MREMFSTPEIVLLVVAGWAILVCALAIAYRLGWWGMR